MSHPSRSSEPCPSQEAIRARCFHPSGSFSEFKKGEIEQSIPDRFETIVRQYPNQLAVKMGDRALTYDELNRAANGIARAILKEGGPGKESIALLFEHGIDVITAIVGVIKAGKCYVALDPSFPKERNSYILEDSQARLIVTNERNANVTRVLAHDSSVLVNIDEIADPVSSNNLGLCISPDDTAIIVYTSGSTGEPKGVVQSHRIPLYYGFTYAGQLYTTCDDRFTLLHSVSFASAEVHLYRSLLNGGALFPFDLKSEGVHRLAHWLEEEQITICHLPTAVFRQLADALPGQQKLSHLRVVHLSGAPITQSDFELYKTQFPAETSFALHMGSTETAGICSAVADHSFSFPSEGAPIGYPYPGKKIFLLDENGQEVGPGEIGEIAVKSRYLAVGYWRRPDLTRAKFLPDPDGGDERIYLTGDLGRMLPDGFLIHLGRKDFMVKIRGYRVEPGEIERALLSHPQIKAVGVVAWDREPGEKYLAAYVVPRQNPPPTIAQLYDFLKTKLPDYMMPSTFVFLESLPLTNGKLDRRALPEPGKSRPDLDTPFVAPRTLVEKELTQIWTEVLSLDQVVVHDNFLELGGHSLVASQVISRVIKSFQLDLPLQSLFQAPTVADMAVIITENQAKKVGQEEMARMLAELEPLSDEQAQRLLLQEMPQVKE